MSAGYTPPNTSRGAAPQARARVIAQSTTNAPPRRSGHARTRNIVHRHAGAFPLSHIGISTTS